MGKLISIYSNINGAGKTTITKAVTTFINKYYNLKMAVIDADSKASIFEERESELKTLETGNTNLLNTIQDLQQTGKSIFPIYKVKADDIKQIEEITKKHDVVFIDIPSDINDITKSNLLHLLDFIFIPFSNNPEDFGANFDSLKWVMQIIDNKQSRLKNYTVFVNNYSDEPNSNQQELLNLFENYKLNTLPPFFLNKSFIEGKSSTIIPMEFSNNVQNLRLLVNSLIEIIK